jgi:hypothetical protein
LNLRPLGEIEHYGAGTKIAESLVFTRDCAAFHFGVYWCDMGSVGL